MSSTSLYNSAFMAHNAHILAHKTVYLTKLPELRDNVSVAPECPVAESKHRQYQNQSVPGAGYILQKK